MRYKEQTMTKLDAQKMKLNTLARRIEGSNISGTEAIELINEVIKDIQLVIDRIELEHND
jgi:hypothetical protein